MNRSFVRYWLPVILWLAFIFWMSTGTFSSENSSLVIEPVLRFLAPRISVQTIDQIHGTIRKAGHVIEYLILGLLLFRAFRGPSRERWRWRWAYFAVIGVFLWALSDEFHQSFVPTRTSSLLDVGFDTAGGILAQFVNALSSYRRAKRRKQ